VIQPEPTVRNLLHQVSLDGSWLFKGGSGIGR
jgi:hypothetical protein